MAGPLEQPDQPEPTQPLDPTALRVSDAERNRVAEILREAAGDGRIDLDELDERLEAAYAARTYADLVPITSDLPVAGAAQVPAVPTRSSPAVPTGPSLVVPGPQRQRSVAIMGGLDRRGIWVVPEHYTVLCFMGGADLDLRQARFAAQEVTITVNVLMGGAEITVNDTTHVVMDGIGIMGAFDGPGSGSGAELDATSPVVRINGVAIMGGVSVKRRPMPGERDQPGWRRRH